jgi:hypothetical protein
MALKSKDPVSKPAGSVPKPEEATLKLCTGTPALQKQPNNVGRFSMQQAEVFLSGRLIPLQIIENPVGQMALCLPAHIAVRGLRTTCLLKEIRTHCLGSTATGVAALKL